MKQFLCLLIIFLSTHYVNAQWQLTTCACNGGVESVASSGSYIFAGTYNGVKMYLSPDNGENWTAVTNNLSTIAYAAVVSSIAISGSNIYIGVSGGNGCGVFKSINNGGNWNAANNGLTYIYNGISFTYGISSIAISEANIFAGTSGGVFLSTNNGGSWSAVNNGLIENTNISSLAINGEKIFAGTEGGGVFLSTNNGGNWIAVNSGLTNLYISTLASSGTDIFAGGGFLGEAGVNISTNNGASWKPMNNGLTDIFGDTASIYTIAINGVNIFVGSSSKGIFLSTNNGGNWKAVNNGLPYDSYNNEYYSINSLTISGSNIFAGTDAGVCKRALSDIVGVNELINENGELRVYPNPANSLLVVSYSLLGKSKTVMEMLDVTGQVVKTQLITGKLTNVDILDLAKGVYIVKVSNENGVAVKKLIKN